MYNREYIFIDSFRVFPVSLNELAKIFNVPGKLSAYNPKFNKLSSILDKDIRRELIEYAKQDSECLHSSLLKAQTFYFNKYHVDIVDCLSLPSLTLKIFKTNYLKFSIPLLKDSEDAFIRRSYFGGATDFYKNYGRNVYYYDVNSLYPYAMTKPMPLNVKSKLNFVERQELKRNNLLGFFGFLEVDIECPKSVFRPVLPYKHEGKTIYPRGKFRGVYFSEELKAVIPLGYKIIDIHAAIEFTQADIFTEYVNEMYNVKKYAKGAERWIAKLLLNSLYGIFGKRLETLETKVINKSDLRGFLTTKVIKNMIDISATHTVLLTVNNINEDMLSKLKIDLELEGGKVGRRPVQSNVAIASAITSYARINMIQFKLDPNVIYTDTDSILTLKPLPSHLIGPELGQMKDAPPAGGCIEELIVLGIKQYGYWFYDENKNIVEKSVWAGYTRDGLTFNDFKDLASGKILVRNIKDRFYRSFNTLSITIKQITLKLEAKPGKKLIHNVYQPLYVNELTYKDGFLKRLTSYIKNIKRKYF